MGASYISLAFTLFFVVDPVGLLTIFAVYLAEIPDEKKRRVIVRSHIIAASVSTLFVVLGEELLHYLGISAAAFIVSGGVLLFLISVDMIYEKQKMTRLKTLESYLAESRENEQEKDMDVAVFPLAIPFLSGPGVIATLLIFTAQTEGILLKKLIIVAINILIFLLSALILLASPYLQRWLGKTGISVLHRLMGLILSALAVQYIINGLKTLGIIG